MVSRETPPPGMVYPMRFSLYVGGRLVDEEWADGGVLDNPHIEAISDRHLARSDEAGDELFIAEVFDPQDGQRVRVGSDTRMMKQPIRVQDEGHLLRLIDMFVDNS